MNFTKLRASLLASNFKEALSKFLQCLQSWGHPCSPTNLLSAAAFTATSRRVDEVRKQQFLSFLGDLKLKEINIIGLKKKFRTFFLQAASTPFQITYLQKIAFKFLYTFKKPGIKFDNYFEFLPCFSLQNKRHQKSC